MQPEELWNDMLNEMKQSISKPSFDTWFIPTKLQKVEKKTFTLAVESDFQKDWLIERYNKKMSHILLELSGEEWTIHYTVDKNIPSPFADRLNKLSHSLSKADLLDKIEALEARVTELENKMNAK